MTFLIVRIILYLLAAFLLGLLIGWLLRGLRCRTELEQARRSWRRQLDELEEDLERERSARRVAESTVIDELPADGLPEAEPESVWRPVNLEDVTPFDTAATVAMPIAATAGRSAAELRDDLKRVEGIGPKIEGLLNEAGIWSYAQLAATDVERLRSILQDAGERFRIHDPGTWPEQSAMAATGRWDALEQFQEGLRGGKLPDA